MSWIAIALLLATLVMLAIHLTSWKLVQAWYGAPGSWVLRRLGPMCVLRMEAAYWALALAAWPLWWSSWLKVVVPACAAIHLAGWGAGEFHRSRVEARPAEERTRQRLVTAVTLFDFVESIVLLAVAWFAARQIL